MKSLNAARWMVFTSKFFSLSKHRPHLSLLPLLFLSIFSLLLLNSHRASAQPSPSLTSACLFSGGESSAHYPFSLHYNARTFSHIQYRYRAGSGWEVPLPRIVKESSGRVLHSDGSCWHELHFDVAQNMYVSRMGHRFEVVNQTHFREWQKNGEKTEFNHVVSSGSGSQLTVLMPSRVENRFGWWSELHYNSSFPGLIDEIEIDFAPGAASPAYRWQFSYSAQGKFERLDLRAGNSTDNLASYVLSYLPGSGALQSISRRGANGGTMGTTQYLYRQQAPGLGLLERELTSLGGETVLEYQSVLAQSPVGAGANVQHAVLSRVSMSTGVEGDPDQSVDIEYLNPATHDGFFLGFGEIRHTDSTGSHTVTTIANQSLGEVGEVRQVESRSASGAVLARSLYSYTAGGVNNSRRVVQNVVSTKYAGAPSNATTLGIQYEWDFVHDRLSRVSSHNQTGYDPVTKAFISQHLEDDIVREFTYAPDIPALGLRARIQRITETSSSTGTLTRDTNYGYAPDHQPRLIEEWESESGTYRPTEVHLNDLGNLTKISRAGAVVQYTWSGKNIAKVSVNPGGVSLHTHYSYYPKTGLLQSITNSSGIRTNFVFDEFFRLQNQNRISSNGAHQQELLSVQYKLAEKTVVVSEAGRKTIYSVDGLGNARKVSTASMTEGVVGASAQQLNSLGQTTRVTHPDFFSTTTGYSLPELQSVHGLTLGYDELGSLSSIVPDALVDGAAPLLSDPFAPGILGSPPVNPQGSTIQSLPSAAPSWMSNFSNLTVGSKGLGSENLQAFALDLPLAKYVVDGLGHLTFERKNTLGQTVESRGSDGVLLKYTYNKHGRLLRVTRPSGAFMEYGYDRAGRIKAATYHGADGSSFTNKYIWDSPSGAGLSVAKGQLAGMTGPYDRVDFGYDPLGRIDTVRQTHLEGPSAISRTFYFEFDPKFGQVQQIFYPSELIGGGVTVNYTYDSQGREQKIFSSAISHLEPSQLVREIVSRNAAGIIEQIDAFNDIREIQHISPVTGGLLRYEIRRISTNELLGDRRHVLDQGRLVEQSVSLGGHTLRELYTEVDSRPFLRQIVRQKDNLAPEIINLEYDAAGRPLVDAERKLSLSYHPNHPALINGTKSGATVYPWAIDQDAQVTSVSGPEAHENASVTYAPDGNVSRITKLNGEWVDFTRGVLGDIIRIRSFNAGGTLLAEYRKFLFGLYGENTDETGEKKGVIRVFGESSAGEEDIIAQFVYDEASTISALAPLFGGASSSTQSSGSSGSPGSARKKKPGSTKPPKPGPTVPVPICGDKIVNGSEECDSDADACDYPEISTCVNCECILDAPPPVEVSLADRYGFRDQTGGFISEQDLWDILYAALTQARSRYGELYEELGIPVESNGPCDDFVLTSAERTLSNVVVADLLVLQIVAGELASELGLSPVMSECTSEVQTPVSGGGEGGGALTAVQLALDVGGVFDPFGVCDGVNCVIYVFQGEFLDAGISLIGMIPYFGDAAKAGRAATTGCRTVAGGTKLSGRAASRVAGFTTRTIVRQVPTGMIHVGDPGKVKMILGTHPAYVNAGTGGGHLHFDMAEAWDGVKAAHGAETVSALNRSALDIVAPLAEQGLVKIEVVLNPGQDLQRILSGFDAGAGLRSEVLHLAQNHGLNLAQEGGSWCFKTGTRAIDPNGVPAYLKNQFPDINWSALGANFKPFHGGSVPPELYQRLMNGEWLKNIDKIKGLLQ